MSEFPDITLELATLRSILGEPRVIDDWLQIWEWPETLTGYHILGPLDKDPPIWSATKPGIVRRMTFPELFDWVIQHKSCLEKDAGRDDPEPAQPSRR